MPVDNISNYDSAKEEIITITSQSDLNLYRLLFVTKQAMCKIVSGGEFDVAKRAVAATKLNEEDELVSVVVLTEQQNVILQSANGFFLRFPIEEISVMKKNAVGVRGIRLNEGDYIENVYYTGMENDQSITYKNKNIEISKIKLGKRDAKGTKLRV